MASYPQSYTNALFPLIEADMTAVQASAHTHANIAVLNAIASAGSGLIITAAERTAIGANTTDISNLTTIVGGHTTTLTALSATSPTIGEKAALAGTVGAPSGVNRYVTDSDTRLVASVYGTQLQSAVNAGTLTTGSTSYVTVLTLVTGSLPLGSYMLEWRGEVTHNASNRQVLCRIFETPTVYAEYNIEPKQSLNYYSIAGFQQLAAISGIHTIVVQLAVTTSGTASIRRAALKLYRTA